MPPWLYLMGCYGVQTCMRCVKPARLDMIYNSHGDKCVLWKAQASYLGTWHQASSVTSLLRGLYSCFWTFVLFQQKLFITFLALQKRISMMRRKYSDHVGVSSSLPSNCIIIDGTASSVTTGQDMLIQWFQFPQEPWRFSFILISH